MKPEGASHCREAGAALSVVRSMGIFVSCAPARCLRPAVLRIPLSGQLLAAASDRVIQVDCVYPTLRRWRRAGHSTHAGLCRSRNSRWRDVDHRLASQDPYGGDPMRRDDWSFELEDLRFGLVGSTRSSRPYARGSKLASPRCARTEAPSMQHFRQQGDVGDRVVCGHSLVL
jgi:hypothetical protein